MRAIGLISVIVFLAAAAGPARAADAQEHFVRVTPDGDFALGCNTFMVAGRRGDGPGSTRGRGAQAAHRIPQDALPWA